MIRNKIYFNLIVFSTIFLILFLLQQFFMIKPNQYMWDAWTYFKISKSLFINNHFSVLTIENDFRGFVFPVYLFVSNFFNYLFNTDISFHLVSSLTLSFLFTVYINLFIKLFVNRQYSFKEGYIRIVLMVFLTLFFFYGLVIWPLTDLYAALISLIAGMLFLYSKNKIKIKYFIYFVCGVLAYIAYNIRTIYQVEIFILLFLIIMYEIKNKKIIRIFNSILFYTTGVLISAFPQIIINLNRYNFLSIWINNQNLFVQQLSWGLKFSKYSTFIGDSYQYHNPAMCFIDNTGLKITQQWEILGYPLTVKSYIKLFFMYPIEYVSIFIKHIVNSFFILFPEQYVQNINKELLLYGGLSIIVVFMFILIVCISYKNKLLSMGKLMFFVLMAIPSFMILFGAVEERFLVLIYINIYSYICFFDYSYLNRYFNKKNIVFISILFIIFFVIVFAIESNIIASLEGKPLYFIN